MGGRVKNQTTWFAFIGPTLEVEEHGLVTRWIQFEDNAVARRAAGVGCSVKIAC